MDCQENSIVFSHLSPQELQRLHNQQIQAFCQFEIRACKCKQTGSLNENFKRVLLQIRSNYILECDISSQKFQSAVTLNYFLNFNLFDINQEQKNYFGTQLSSQRCFLNIWEEHLMSPGSLGINEGKKLNQRSFQLKSLNSENFDKFKNVMLSKSIMFGIKDLSKEYKPLKCVRTKEYSKVFYVQRICDKRKWEIQAQNIQNIKNKKDLVSQLCFVSKLSHRNIQKIERVVRSKNTLNIIKELHQTNLTEYSKFTRCGIEKIGKIIKTVLLAIQYLHANFIIHSQINADNIILNEIDGNIKNIAITGFSKVCTYYHQHNWPQQQSQLNTKNKQQFQIFAYQDIESVGYLLYNLLLHQNQNPQNTFTYNKDEQHQYMIAQVESIQQIPNSAIVLLKELLGLSEKGKIDAKTALQNIFIKQYSHLSQAKPGSTQIQRPQQYRRKDEPN